MIRMEKIKKTYGAGTAQVQALKNIDLEIKENEFVGMIGPSGSGKSTLMNIMGCLDVYPRPESIILRAKALPLSTTIDWPRSGIEK